MTIKELTLTIKLPYYIKKDQIQTIRLGDYTSNEGESLLQILTRRNIANVPGLPDLLVRSPSNLSLSSTVTYTTNDRPITNNLDHGRFEFTYKDNSRRASTFILSGTNLNS